VTEHISSKENVTFEETVKDAKFLSRQTVTIISFLNVNKGRNNINKILGQRTDLSLKEF
jgi:hypothetical protein